MPVKQFFVILFCVAAAQAGRVSEWSSPFTLTSPANAVIGSRPDALRPLRPGFAVLPAHPGSSIAFVVRGVVSPAGSSLRVYALDGRLVADLSGYLRAGQCRIQWNPPFFPAGIFIARLYTGSLTMTHKFALYN